MRRAFLRRKGYPSLLYKYRVSDPNNADSVSHLKDVLLGSRLWLASPNTFNDPFDMAAHVVFEGAKDIWLRRVIALTGTHIADRKERRKKIREFRSASSSQIVPTAQTAYHRHIANVGVCSFAGDGRSVLMWSHYANNHAGICLVIDLARDVNTFLFAVKITYSPAYPVINWANDPREELKRTLLCKDEAWSYENERRIVLPDRANTQLPFHSAAVRGIILGCRISDAAKTGVMAMLDERGSRNMPHVIVFQAIQHPSQYKLCLKRVG